MTFSGETFGVVYWQLGQHLKAAGTISRPRGLETRELLGVSLKVEDPRSRLAYSPGRKFSLPLALGEFVWIMSGRDDVEYMRYYSKRFSKFSDDGETLYGAYGKRRDLGAVVDKLTADPDSRQAVTVIFRPEDAKAESRDVPCTIAWQFFVRDGRLQMVCTMRSNDFVWGLPYDLFTNTLVQEWVAQRLGVGLGSYYHYAGSMHVYEPFYDALDREWAPVRMPPFHVEEFPFELGEAERVGRYELSWVGDDPAVLDASRVFVSWAHWRAGRKELARREAATVGEWARIFMEDQYSE